jgi:hypothetical protein
MGAENRTPSHRDSIPGPSSPQRVAILARISSDWEATGKLMKMRSLCWAKMIKQARVLYTCNILGKSLCHFFRVRTSQFVSDLVVLVLRFRQHRNQHFDFFFFFPPKVMAGSQYTELILTRTLDQHG